MGYMDYVCFIQRNGQILEQFNETKDSSGPAGSDCILVLIPNSFTKRQILSWPLSKFLEFESIEAVYDSEEREFDDIEGYNKVFDHDSHWYDRAIWVSNDYSDYWLVNFEPDAYDGLIRNPISYKELHKYYIRLVFYNRGQNLFKTEIIDSLRKFYYNEILDSSKENIIEYDKQLSV